MDFLDQETLLFVRYTTASLVAVLLLAAMASPWVAAFCQGLARRRQRVFYDKFAKQIAQMGLLFALATLPCSLGALVLMHQYHPATQTPGMPHPLEQPPALLAAALCLEALVLLGVYAGDWSRWKTRRPLQNVLGWAAGASTFMALCLALVVKWLLATHPEALVTPPFPDRVLEALASLTPLSTLWPFLALAACGGVGAAGVLGGAYLLTRRDREDYGRDYYAFACRAAAWTGVAGLPPAMLSAWWLLWIVLPRFPEGPLSPVWRLGAGGAVLLGAVAMALLTVAKAEQPLRKKPTLILCTLLLCMAVVGLGFLVAKLYSFH